jgi:hypothetical protein
VGAASCVVYEVGMKSGHSQRGRPGNETQLGGRSGNETPPLHVWVSSLRESKWRPGKLTQGKKATIKKLFYFQGQ